MVGSDMLQTPLLEAERPRHRRRDSSARISDQSFTSPEPSIAGVARTSMAAAAKALQFKDQISDIPPGAPQASRSIFIQSTTSAINKACEGLLAADQPPLRTRSSTRTRLN